MPATKQMTREDICNFLKATVRTLREIEGSSEFVNEEAASCHVTAADQELTDLLAEDFSTRV